MDRRRFLTTAFACASYSALASQADTVLAVTRSASAEAAPWRKAFAGVRADFSPTQLRSEGQWPIDFRGMLLRNGPARFERAGERYQHWFDGDGMVQQFSIANGKVQHQGKFIRTKKFLVEEMAGAFRYPTAGTIVKNPLPVRNNDDLNVANTALIPWQGEVLALWEGGSAHRLDPQNLSTLGVKDFGEQYKQLPFSAHPLPDGQGGMWNFGSWYVSGQPLLLLYHIGAQSEMRRLQQIKLPQASYLHAFSQSADKLVFFLGSCVYEQGHTFIDAFKWRPERGSQLLIVDKADFSQQQWVELPAGFAFHFGQAWQQGGELHLQACLYPDPSIMLEGMSQLLQGGARKQSSVAELVTIRVALGKTLATATIDRSGLAMEFPQFVAGFDRIGTAASSTTAVAPLFGVSGSHRSEAGLSDSLVRVDATGRQQQYQFAAGVVAEEPLLVRGGKQILLSWLDYRKQQCGISLFNSHDVTAGPIAQASMDRMLPLGFHGCWLDA
ncbi:MAG: carotenoid oxygenase family protein [Rheinheimera sp.]